MPKISSPVASLALSAVVISGCGSPPPPPGPGEGRGAIPDLQSLTVMVLPVQLKSGVPQELPVDLEVAHALRTRGEGVRWVFPPEIDAILQRSPGVPAQARGLPVRSFLQAEVNRIGEPLFGHIIRLAGLTGADVALIPVELKRGESGTLVLSAALIGTRTGRVVWFGVVEGRPGDVSDPATLASTADVLSKVILPFG